MATIGELYGYLDRIAPFKLQEKWDNSGLLVGDREQLVTKAMLALDITNDVVNEAIIAGVGLIISHHPVIFEPIKSVTPQDNPVVYKLMRHGIAAICAHTNLDAAKGGVNDVLAELLGLKNVRGFRGVAGEDVYKIVVFAPKKYADDIKLAMTAAGAGTIGNYSGCAFESLGKGCFRPEDEARPFFGKTGKLREVKESRIEMVCPKASVSDVVAAMKRVHPYEEPVYDLYVNYAMRESSYLGRIGELSVPLTASQLAMLVKEKINAGAVRYTEGGGEIKTVAVCGGAGAEFIAYARGAGAQAYVTGDIKHNVFIDAKNSDFTLIDAGHFATELPVMSAVKNKLQNEFPDVQFIIGGAARESVKYL